MGKLGYTFQDRDILDLREHESLALRTNVARKGIPIADTRCLFCGRADEDGAHLFIKCKAAKEVWRELALERERIQLEKIGSVHAMFDFLWGLDEKKRLHVLAFWWLWWSNRNKLREGEMPLTANDVARRTRSNVLEYLEIFGKPSDKPKPDKWRPPVEADYKINADGSFVPGQHHAGWGVAVRTADGSLVCARAGRQEHINDAFAAEVIAMSHAIHTAADLGIVRVELETDSQLVAEALDMHKVDSSAYAAVIEDMKYQLKLWFSKFTIHVVDVMQIQ